MPTLNKTKKETKIILKWGGIFLFIVLFFLISGRFAEIIKENLTPPPPPDASFGKLPSIPFPNQQKENIAYSLDTLSGFLPDFPDRAKVYKINIPQPTLLALDKTKEKVEKLGFASKETEIGNDVYQWVDQSSIVQRRITINIFSQDFTISSPYLIIPSLQSFENSNEQDSAIETAKAFLSNMSLFPKDLDEEKTKTILYSIEDNMIIPASKISNAKIVRVDFFQKDLDNLPIYYEKGITSTIDLLIGKENNRLKVLDASYFYKNVSQTFSTYAIKSASEAFTQLQQGEGYIASKPQNKVEVTIKKVFLGYYIGENQQEFLMPIIIFIGENDFVAYISAVRGESIDN